MALKVAIYGLTTIPEVKQGDDIAKLVVESASREGVGIEDGDVVVVSSKIVAKAEGRIVDLRNVSPSPKALELARITGKDPRFIEVVLRESVKIVKAAPGHLIVETRHGVVCANAGVDKSNVAGTEEVVALLPSDPDEWARRIRREIKRLTGREVAVVVTDTYGRPLRNGQIDMAIGLSGIEAFRDYRDKKDMKGYVMRVKLIAIADEIAAAAELVKGNGGEMVPVAILRGLKYERSESASARDLVMPEERWLFR